PLIGFFANTLALRVAAPPAASFTALLDTVRGAALAAYAHPDLPFEKLVEDLHLAPTPGRTPLFQVMVGEWRAPWAELALAGVTVEPYDLPPGAAKFDLNLRLAPAA